MRRVRIWSFRNLKLEERSSFYNLSSNLHMCVAKNTQFKKKKSKISKYFSFSAPSDKLYIFLVILKSHKSAIKHPA